MQPAPFSAVNPTKILYLISPFRHFLKKIVTGGFLILSATVVALLWANIAPHSYHKFWHTQLTISLGALAISKSMLHWIDEALMALFFFTVGLEIKREILIGELSSLKKAALPVAAALGGMIFPAAIYFLFNSGSDAAHGWGIPMATDIAFALAALSLLRNKVPFGVRIFLSALAIADDIGAVLIIALFYTQTIFWHYLIIAAGFVLALWIINLLGVNKTLPYALLGIGIWFAILGSGIHATVAGVIVAFFIPAKGKYDTGTFLKETQTYLDKIQCQGRTCGHTILLDQTHLNSVQAIELACRNTLTPLQHLEHSLNNWVALLILPTFALANAGVIFDGFDIVTAISHPVSLGVALGLMAGKPLGIFIFTFIASKLMRAPLSKGITWVHILGASMLGGIGFTMSIFIAGISFKNSSYMELAKFGIIVGSFISAIMGLSLLYFTQKTEKPAA